MGHGVVKLAEDKYVEWSTVVDAPITYVLSRQEAVNFFGEDRVARSDRNGHSYLDYEPGDRTAFNRAGPWESCITKEAILRKYSSPEAEKSFVLQVEDIRPYTTCDDDGKNYWVPWEPGSAPVGISLDSKSVHSMVEIEK